MSFYNVDYMPDHELWPLLGFSPASDLTTGVPVQIWNTEHLIFNFPISYGADNLTPIYDYGDEGDVLNVYDNATALAGVTLTLESNESIIVLRNNKQTLYNGFLIDEFNQDLDDPTYLDSYELWLNEIAFMLSPTINSPEDITIEYGTIGAHVT